ncbi:MAG: tetratricopeptide repeat protein, partial [Anaerolineae bacterium]
DEGAGRRNGVVFICTYRGEDISIRPQIETKLQTLIHAGRGRNLALQRLDQTGTGELIRRCLVLTAPAPLFETRVYRETEGNPLFVLETLRALQEEGRLYQDEHGVWHTPWDETTRDYIELRLPPEVSRVIARRLEHLSPEERDTLNAAAVLERDFTFALLHRTSRLAYSATLRALNDLLGRQLLVEDRAAYRFSHAKIREVVYGALGEAERQELHRRAAVALQALHPDRVELLAHHFELGQVKDRAAHYHQQAGERAAAGHAHVTALGHYDRAVILAEEAGLSADFRFRVLADREATLDVLDRREEQAADLRAMDRLARRDPGRLAEVHRRRAWLLAHTSRFDEAEAAAREALALAESQGDESAQSAALTALGMTIDWHGEPARAEPHLRAAVELSRQAADLQQEAQARQALANTLLGVKAFQEARAEAETALGLREMLHDRPGQAGVLGILGVICMEQGATQDAVAYYHRALEIYRAIGYRSGEARNLLNMANVLYFEGQVSQALDYYDQAATIFQSIGHGRGEASVRLNAASVRQTIIGDDESAMRDAEAALAYYRSVGNRGGEGQSRVVLGEIAFQQGDLKTARSHVDAGIAALQAVNEHWMEVQARRVSASLWLAQGRPDSALRELEAAESLCRSLGMEGLAVGLLALRGEALLALGRPNEALEATTEAVARLRDGVEQAYLVYFRHYQALLAVGREGEARSALEQAHRALQAVIAGLSPEQQQTSLERVPEHRAIVVAWEAAQPRRLIVRLPRADAPTGRPLRDDEYVDVTWTVAAPEDGAIRRRVARRRHRLLRLLGEAHAQGAAPAYTHLAEALRVGLRTIERDMATLRQTHPNLPPTRGAREHGSAGAGEKSSPHPISPAH